MTNNSNKDKIPLMKVLEVTDLFKNKAVQIELPQNIKFSTYQLVLLNTGKEKVVGKVITFSLDKNNPYLDEDYSFERILTDEEIKTWKENVDNSFAKVIEARELSEKNNLKMHFFQAREDFNGKQLSLFFTSKAKIDFRELLKDLSSKFKKRIYLQRVSANDRLSMVGTYDISGRYNTNDFAKFFKDRPTMNVVRDQGIMLRNNERIFDMSGKIKGSMVYEVEHYREMRRFLPHIKQKVRVNGRDGLVTGLDILNQRVKIRFEDGGFSEPFHIDEVEIPGRTKKVSSQNPAKLEKKEEFGDLKEKNEPLVSNKSPVKSSMSDRIRQDIENAAKAAKK